MICIFFLIKKNKNCFVFLFIWIKMDLKNFGNFNWTEMDSKDQNLDLTQSKRIHFCPFQSIFVCWEVINAMHLAQTILHNKLILQFPGMF